MLSWPQMACRCAAARRACACITTMTMMMMTIGMVLTRWCLAHSCPRRLEALPWPPMSAAEVQVQAQRRALLPEARSFRLPLPSRVSLVLAQLHRQQLRQLLMLGREVLEAMHYHSTSTRLSVAFLLAHPPVALTQRRALQLLLRQMRCWLP